MELSYTFLCKHGLNTHTSARAPLHARLCSNPTDVSTLPVCPALPLARRLQRPLRRPNSVPLTGLSAPLPLGERTRRVAPAGGRGPWGRKREAAADVTCYHAPGAGVGRRGAPSSRPRDPPQACHATLGQCLPGRSGASRTVPDRAGVPSRKKAAPRGGVGARLRLVFVPVLGASASA